MDFLYVFLYLLVDRSWQFNLWECEQIETAWVSVLLWDDSDRNGRADVRSSVVHIA